ncbi:MAG: carbon-nitrogen hydrolase family protein [Chitinophagaceae bacterium]
MKISVAQVRLCKGDITANIEIHKRLIKTAILHNADAVFFPELSITGYEPTLARDLATSPDDSRLESFQHMSDANNIMIGIGVPTKAENGTLISMLIFQPGRAKQVYSKQQLHADELPWFVQGNKQVVLTIGNKKIAPAICYESLQEDHANIASLIGADIYIASVAKSQKGIDKALLHYPSIAKKFSMPVLMANCIGYCDNFESVGKSSVWTSQGNMVGQLDDEEGLLIFDTETAEVMITR